jgi:hypothetical protein
MNGSFATLTAPNANFYLWSTGQGTQSITVSDTGTYVVWVNQGSGMIGSEPFFLSDLQYPCGTAGIEAIATDSNRSVVAYYDLLGREIEMPRQGQIYFVRFSDGTVEKVIWR